MRLFNIQVSKYINFCDEAQSLIQTWRNVITCTQEQIETVVVTHKTMRTFICTHTHTPQHTPERLSKA